VSRTLWNAMIDRRPAAIVRAAGAGDVVQAVNFARENRLLLAVRGGGHNIAGKAACDGELMLDLSAMKSVRMDPAAKRARVEPGALLGDFDRETQDFGLSTPTSINFTTGMSGLTPRGGFGWQSRKRGLTIDNLVAADVVLASGEFVQASATQHADLFWALRGGGGNFGVVTSFEYQLHSLGPQVLAGLVVYPMEQAKQVFEGCRNFTAAASDDMTVWMVLRKAPPLPFLPAGRCTRQAGGRRGLLLDRRAEAGQGDDPAAARLRQALRRARGAHALRRLADRLRPAADAGRAQLLEVARLQRNDRGGRTHPVRRDRPVAER
jgi:FAD/FMN-containing dehydrogenase